MIEGLNTVTMGIEDSLSTDTTELSSMNVEQETQVPQHQDTEEENHQPQDEETGDTEIVTPTEEMYLPDLDNTPLSQGLKDGIAWGMEDEVMMECPKLKQYFRVDTLLVQALSGRVCLYTNDEVETFPIHCSKTKFSPSLLDKALKGAEKQRATPQGSTRRTLGMENQKSPHQNGPG